MQEAARSAWGSQAAWWLAAAGAAGALAVATWLLSGITLNAPTTSGKILALLIVALIFGVLNAIVSGNNCCQCH